MEPFNGNGVLALLRKQNPDREFLPDFADLGQDLSETPNNEAEALLRRSYGQEWTGLEESVPEVSRGVI